MEKTIDLVLQVGVKVILRNSEGKFLLLHRNPEKYPDMKGRDGWDIVGGRINVSIPLLENLKREIKEESGFDFNGEPRLVAAQDIMKPGMDKHVVRLTYVADIAVDQDPVLSEEHDSFKWFSLEELKQLPDLDAYFAEVLSKGLL